MKKTAIKSHDSYFRKSMEDPRVARGFLQQHLPRDIQRVTDFATLKLRKDSFIDPEFRHRMSDVLFSVELDGRAGYFYSLIEQQSKPDRQMPFRILRYMLLIMERHMREEGSYGKQGVERPLPVIVPIMLYNGKQRPYPYSTDIFDLFDDPAGIARETFCKPFSLVDLSQIPDEVLREEKWSGLMSFFMKHAYDQDILQFIDDKIGELLQAIEQSDSGDYYIELLARYIALTSESNYPEQVLVRLSNHLSSETGEKVMTIAEHFIRKGEAKGEARGVEKGLKQGIEQGIEKGMRQVALNMLESGMDKKAIAKVTQLSLEEIEAIAPAKH